MTVVAGLFVVIWSTGFIVAKLIVPVADPNLFLTARFASATVLFVTLAVAARVSWPRWRQIPLHLLAGVLLQGGYLGGTYWAVAHGVTPGAMALLGALQPPLTAALGIFVLREVPSRQTWLGLVLGVGGVALVMVPRLAEHGAGALHIGVVLIAVGAVLSLTVGTLLQRSSIAAVDIRASAALQNAGSLVVAAPITWLHGETRWISSVAVWGSLAWAALVLSGMGTVMLVWMVRRGRAANVASLMLLAPPLAATEAYLLFDDGLTAIQLVGFAIALAGVFLCRPAAAPARERP